MYLVEHKETRGFYCTTIEAAIAELHFWGYYTPGKEEMLRALEDFKYWEGEDGASITETTAAPADEAGALGPP